MSEARLFVKYELKKKDFRPVAFERVRWLEDKDYHYMRDYAKFSRELWNSAKKEGYTYCAVIEEEKIIAMAAVWKYSEDKWEAAAVSTRKGYENKGLCKQAVSFVSDHILSEGKTATLTTAQDNLPMRKVAEALGYRLTGSF